MKVETRAEKAGITIRARRRPDEWRTGHRVRRASEPGAVASLEPSRSEEPAESSVAAEKGSTRLEGDESNSLLMSGFFEEVQRRKVYRVAAAYIVAAGFMIQIASAAFPAWELPNWSLRLVIALLLIGFPIALILAWAYDMTPQGIRVAAGRSFRKAPAQRYRPDCDRSRDFSRCRFLRAAPFVGPRIDKSIAVLPFQNLSDEKENAYFADGIQDDILTNLSKIGDLKVISRTSVMSYRAGGTRSAREIGKALGVASYPRRQCPPGRQSRARERAVGRCREGPTSLGGRLRPGPDRRLCHSNRPGAKDRRAPCRRTLRRATKCDSIARRH